MSKSKTLRELLREALDAGANVTFEDSDVFTDVEFEQYRQYALESNQLASEAFTKSMAGKTSHLTKTCETG